MLDPGSNSSQDSRVTSAIVVGGGIVCALLLGTSIGEGGLLSFALFGAVAAITIVLTLQDRIWILIPIFWYVPGMAGFLPLPFSVRELAVLTASSVFVMFLALRFIRAEARMELLDWIVFLNIGYLVTVFIRNPVGLSAIGSAMVGGRPYFNSLIGFVAFLVLSRVTLKPGLAKILPLFSCAAQVGISLLGALAHYLPATAPLIARIYSGVDVSEYARQVTGSEDSDINRVTDLLAGSQAGILTLVSYFPPLSLLSPFYQIRFLCFLAVCTGFGLAGFRDGIAWMAFVFVMSAYLRGGLKKAFLVVFIAALAVFALEGAHNAGVTLPKTAQRALSFLPGNWDADAKEAAEGSSNWRFYMWEVVLSTNTYIHNKLLGDGFGFSSEELQIMEQEQNGGAGFIGAAEQESFLIQGAYHSGPLSAVRYVGAVGLLFYLILLVVAAIYAWKLIRRCQGTDYFPIALFVGIPAIYEPLQYTLIFGGFDSGFPTTLFVCGMLKLISKGCHMHTPQPRSPAAESQSLAKVQVATS
ncbi:MAG: hypothetical protein JO207_08600 [Verrucomicrobia bacterium]|nr:hypothetical protein [Verrucomicrobiota bacterium]